VCCQSVDRCLCYFCPDKSSRHIGALQHLGEKGDQLTAMLVQVREILPKYRSGALPKVFKVVPKFEAWEEVCRTLVLQKVLNHLSCVGSVDCSYQSNIASTQCNTLVVRSFILVSICHILCTDYKISHIVERKSEKAVEMR